MTPPTLAEIQAAVAALRDANPGVWVSADGLFRVKEADAARALGVAARTLRQWRGEGRSPPFHVIGSAPTYALGDLLAWARTRRHDPAAHVRGGKWRDVA